MTFALGMALHCFVETAQVNAQAVKRLAIRQDITTYHTAHAHQAPLMHYGVVQQYFQQHEQQHGSSTMSMPAIHQSQSQSKNQVLGFIRSEQHSIMSSVALDGSAEQTAGGLQCPAQGAAKIDVLSEPLAVPMETVEPFLCLNLTADLHRAELASCLAWIRTKRIEQEEWTAWQPMNADAHPDTDGGISAVPVGTEKFVSRLVFLPKETRWVQYRFELRKTALYRTPVLASVAVHFFSPGATPAAHTDGTALPTNSTPKANAALKRNAGTAFVQDAQDVQNTFPRPNFVTRTQWGCPTGETAGPRQSGLVSTTVTHLVVHHSFEPGNNVSDWAAAVRGIWNFHVNSNGWSDIGYNWLVDQNGVLYQGRAWIGDNENTVGAHFCGTNGGTMGVCMLGNFSQIAPPEPAMATLVQILAYRASRSSIMPEGQAFHAGSSRTLPTICGHRDGICATECPGNLLYPLLPQIRSRVAAALLATSVADNSPNSSVRFEALTQALSGSTIEKQAFLYSIPMQSAVQLAVYDAQGRRVATLVSTTQSAGTYTAELHTQLLGAGMYFAVLECSEAHGCSRLTRAFTVTK
jgi:hypothetical protein